MSLRINELYRCMGHRSKAHLAHLRSIQANGSAKQVKLQQSD